MNKINLKLWQPEEIFLQLRLLPQDQDAPEATNSLSYPQYWQSHDLSSVYRLSAPDNSFWGLFTKGTLKSKRFKSIKLCFMNCFYTFSFHVAFDIGQTSLSGIINVLRWPESFPPPWWPCLTHIHLWTIATTTPKQSCEREHRPHQSPSSVLSLIKSPIPPWAVNMHTNQRKESTYHRHTQSLSSSL